jgi:hypothetical protein
MPRTKKQEGIEKIIALMGLIIKAYQKKLLTKDEMTQYFSDLGNITKKLKW